MVNIGDHFNLAKLSGWCLEDPPPQCSPVCLVAKGCRTLHFPLWLSDAVRAFRAMTRCAVWGWATHISRGSPATTSLQSRSHRLVHLLVRAGAGTVQVAGHLCSIVEAVLLHTRIKHRCQNQVAFMCIWIIWYHLVSRIICDIRHDTGALEFGRPEVPKAHHWLWHAMACCPELSAARLLQHGSSLSYESTGYFLEHVLDAATTALSAARGMTTDRMPLLAA